MGDDHEILADNGDLFLLHGCVSDDGCVMLEYFSFKEGGRPPGSENEERCPDNDLHIPRNKIPELIRALQEYL